jgi:hypothetical protein
LLPSGIIKLLSVGKERCELKNMDADGVYDYPRSLGLPFKETTLDVFYGCSGVLS